jgi:hypothetical protein
MCISSCRLKKLTQVNEPARIKFLCYQLIYCTAFNKVLPKYEYIQYLRSVEYVYSTVQ